MEVSDISIRHVLADDNSAVVLLETTATLGGRTPTSGPTSTSTACATGRRPSICTLPSTRRQKEKFYAG